MTKPAELFAGLPLYSSFAALLAAHPQVNRYPSFGISREAPLSLSQARAIEREALRQMKDLGRLFGRGVAAVRRIDLIETEAGLTPWMIGFDIYAEKSA